MPESLISRAMSMLVRRTAAGGPPSCRKATGMLVLAAVASAVLSLQPVLDARAGAAGGTGIVVGIIDHGVARVYVAGSAGNGVAAGRHTLFEIGSVTKTFTATTLATMVLDGAVRLNDPIATYLPKGVRALSKDGKAITLLDLAEQRSGLPRLPTNMDDVTGDDPYADYTLSDMYSFLNGYTLERDPGVAYEYSNYGIGLLGQLLANRAGTSYPQLVRRSVLDPLGMTETTFAVAGSPDPSALGVGHDLSGAAVSAWHEQSILPAGGILSNLSDMLKYLRCTMGEGPLARACLFAEQPRATGLPGQQIGLVWNVNSRTGVTTHDGATNGFLATIAISQDRQTGVVALSNGPVVADIAAHAIDPSYPIAVCPTSVPADKTDLASYAGVYCNAMSGMTFTVAATSRSDALSIALLPQPSLSFQRIDSDTYYAASVDATFKFVRKDGKIIGLRLMQMGQTIPAVRLNAQAQPVDAQLPPAFPAVMTLDPSLMREYVGSYASPAGTFTVTLLKNNSLYVQLTGQPAVPLYASAKDRFFLKVVDAQIRFDRNAAGAVSSLTLHQGGQDLTATRRP
jgi:D-alanyl-D-alanine-carboxypeptidase/D-alanyl-D-alanine-endopeptidase